MEQVFKNGGLSTALEIILLHLDAQTITSCRLVSTYLRNFIDSRRSLLNHQKQLICQQLNHVFPYLEIMDFPIHGPLTQFSVWKAILNHACGQSSINDYLTEVILMIMQDQSKKQTILSGVRSLMQYVHTCRYGTYKHISYILKILKKCKVDMPMK